MDAEPNTWVKSTRYAKQRAIALMAEPIGLMASVVYFVAPALDATLLGRFVGITPLLTAGVAGIVVTMAGGRFMKHTHKHDQTYVGPQAAQVSIRFGQAGNDLFAAAGFSQVARNVQRVLSGVVPIALLGFFIATE